MQNDVYNGNLTLCPNCFAQLDAQGKCSVCGYDATQAVRDYGKLAPGTVLKDRYYIGRPLGQGGFGITYLSYDLMLNIKLAIKEYYPSGIATRIEGSKTVTSTNPENVAEFREGLGKFLAEARTLAKFSEYANIVSVRDYFEYNGTAYMVMGYLEGQTLLEYLKQHGNKLPFAETYKILAPVMDALNAVHASGLIHRDISPDNIFITHDGTVKLLDFGAAKSAMALANQQNHSIVLKKGYSPSEQYREDGRLGPWTDVYSMGATFYRCLTGEVPQDSIDRIFNDKVQSLREKAQGTPKNAINAILKAMSLNEADRFQNMSDFKTVLNGYGYVSGMNKIEAEKTTYQKQGTQGKQIKSEADNKPKVAQRKNVNMGIVIPIVCLVVFLGWILFGRNSNETVAENTIVSEAVQTQEPQKSPVAEEPVTLNAEESKYEEEAKKILGDAGWNLWEEKTGEYETEVRKAYFDALKQLKTAMNIRQNPLVICDYAELALTGYGCENVSAEQKDCKREAILLLTPLAKNDNLRALRVLKNFSNDTDRANYDKRFKELGGDYAVQAGNSYDRGIQLWKVGKKSESLKYFEDAATLIDKYEETMTPMEKFIYWNSYMSYNSNGFDLYRGVVAYLYETGKAGVKDQKKAKMWKSKLNSGTMLTSEVFDHADDEEFGFYECE